MTDLIKQTETPLWENVKSWDRVLQLVATMEIENRALHLHIEKLRRENERLEQELRASRYMGFVDKNFIRGKK